jgi:preprotein translocase subunit Sss1
MATDSVMLRFGIELLAAVALVGFIGFLILLIMRS